MRYIVTIALLCTTFMLCAQNKQSKIGYVAMSNIDNYITIDTATVRVWYALNALDIKDEDSGTVSVLTTYPLNRNCMELV